MVANLKSNIVSSNTQIKNLFKVATVYFVTAFVRLTSRPLLFLVINQTEEQTHEMKHHCPRPTDD